MILSFYIKNNINLRCSYFNNMRYKICPGINLYQNYPIKYFSKKILKDSYDISKNKPKDENNNSYIPNRNYLKKDVDFINNEYGYYFKNNPLKSKELFELDSLDDKNEYIFGIYPVFNAVNSSYRYCKELFLDSNINLSIRYIQEIIDIAKTKNILINYISNDYLNKYTGNRPHDGVVLKCHKKNYLHIKKSTLFLESVIETKKNNNLIIILDQVIDPQNLGSIIRSCYLLGVDYILINKSNKPSITPAVSNASSGVSEAIPIFTVKYLKNFLEQSVINYDFKIITTFLDNKNDLAIENSNTYYINNFSKINNGDNAIIVFGSEGSGVSETLNRIGKEINDISISNKLINNMYNVLIESKINKDEKIKRKLVDSLNVGVSAGILIEKISNLIKI